MVTQVGPADFAPQGLERQHQVPFDAHLFQPPFGATVPRILEVTEVIEQYSDDDPTLVRSLQSVEERRSGGVEQQDIELDMQAFLRPPDRLGHGVEGLLVVREQCRFIATDEWHRAQGAIEFDDRLQPYRPGLIALHEVESLCRLEDVAVDLCLFATPASRKPRAPHDQEQDDAHIRHEEDRQQPGHGGLWPTVAGHDD